ncbi:hypothetical protein [Anoxybacillus sp.]|uniref:hypothetical protein n=1 Tax=Anoxybacillus sp. TaxID=1872573 RepID=UPI002634B07D|nr:hypothetical protein [uncultured Anoxybacillus sp.]
MAAKEVLSQDFMDERGEFRLTVCEVFGRNVIVPAAHDRLFKGLLQTFFEKFKSGVILYR